MKEYEIIEIQLSELGDHDSILRRQADVIENFGSETQEIVSGLIRTFEAHPIAVGLAAPQIGISSRVIVVNLTKGKEPPHTVLINPKIEEVSSVTEIGYESCMSIPNYKGKVERALEISVSYSDTNGKDQIIHAKGFKARVLQHEIDHLNGILYTDRMKNEKIEPTDIFLRDKISKQAE